METCLQPNQISPKFSTLPGSNSWSFRHTVQWLGSHLKLEPWLFCAWFVEYIMIDWVHALQEAINHGLYTTVVGFIQHVKSGTHHLSSQMIEMDATMGGWPIDWKIPTHEPHVETKPATWWFSAPWESSQYFPSHHVTLSDGSQGKHKHCTKIQLKRKGVLKCQIAFKVEVPGLKRLIIAMLSGLPN